MSVPTLHRLLWGPVAESIRLHEWPVRPWEIPAIGLPTRVATLLFQAARKRDLPSEWQVAQGPLTWCLCDTGQLDLLAAGRRHQLGMGQQPASQSQIAPANPAVQRTRAWEVHPHAAYFLPGLMASSEEICRESYALYCDVLLLLTALDGGEAILHELFRSGVGAVPFVDKWGWRSRIHLPKAAWQHIESVLRWAEEPDRDRHATGHHLDAALKDWVPKELTIDDFVLERVDIRLGISDDAEVVRSVRRAGATDTDLPLPLWLRADRLGQRMYVRIGQVGRSARRKDILRGFPRLDPETAHYIMEQVAYVFQSPSHASRLLGNAHPQSVEPNAADQVPKESPHHANLDLVLLPEVTIPQPEVRTLRRLVGETGRAALAGLYWRELKPVYGPGREVHRCRKWFVNEAELVIPIGRDDRGPTSIRWFRVRKPMPAHSEEGLARSLTERSGNRTAWSILEGQRWYRFVHRQWGDFTVAICSDLIDTEPWRSMRGELLHLFLVGFNKDVDLYDSLTWVRAYENYVNVVAVNHGHYGGSFLWTPRRKHGRELARLRGARLFLVADVELSISSLLKAQQCGVDAAVVGSACEWIGRGHEPLAFKSPPPGYQRRALLSD